MGSNWTWKTVCDNRTIYRVYKNIEHSGILWFGGYTREMKRRVRMGMGLFCGN